MNESASREQAMYYGRAELYDRIYHFKDYAADADIVHAVLIGEGIADGSRVLEAACGTGSFLGPLARHYDVTGFDLSPAMLAIARGKVPDASVFVSDMRDFEVPEVFDAVLCLFSSIGYLLTEEDLAAAFRSFRRALRPGGVVVVEPFVMPEDWREDATHLMTYEGEDLKCCRANASKREGDIAILDFHWMVVRPGAGVEHFTEVHRLRLWRVEEMGRILGEVGFDWRFEGAGRGRYVGRAT